LRPQTSDATAIALSTGNWCYKRLQSELRGPQGLKPAFLLTRSGTAEAVPFPKLSAPNPFLHKFIPPKFILPQIHSAPNSFCPKFIPPQIHPPQIHFSPNPFLHKSFPSKSMPFAKPPASPSHRKASSRKGLASQGYSFPRPSIREALSTEHWVLSTAFI